MENLMPMVSLNVYLLPDFRREVFNKVLRNLEQLSPETRQELTQMIKEFVKISGFRNPLSAPQTLVVRNLEAAFEKESRVVKAVISAWAETEPDLQAALKSSLPELGFPVNEQAPGYPDPENAFLPDWPQDLSFDKLADQVRQKTQTSASNDEIALMAVWLTGQLPASQPQGEQS